MCGQFISAKKVKRDHFEGSSLAWFSRPSETDAKELVVIEVTFDKGGCHNFHKHPHQEEVLYVLEGQVEQWVDKKKSTLGRGDSAFIPADTVHGSFNLVEGKAKLLAILGPCIGPEGYELVDVSTEAPWNTMR